MVLRPGPDVSNTEVFDMDNDSANGALGFREQDVLDITDADNVLTFLGDEQDSVGLQGGWTQRTDPYPGFVEYTLGLATVRIDNEIEDITVSLT